MAGLLTYGYRFVSWPSRFPSGTPTLQTTRLQLRGQLRHWSANFIAHRTAFPITPVTGPSLGLFYETAAEMQLVSRGLIDNALVRPLLSGCGDAKQLVFGNTVRR